MSPPAWCHSFIQAQADRLLQARDNNLSEPLGADVDVIMRGVAVLLFLLLPFGSGAFLGHEEGGRRRSTALLSLASRRSMVKSFMLLSTLPKATRAEDKIYSANARNMARLGSGDGSAGSVYDNDPSNPKARSRRAMIGCKNSDARQLATEGLKASKLSEKECNQLVMSGETDFMLKTLQRLDCPTCPYGIGKSL